MASAASRHARRITTATGPKIQEKVDEAIKDATSVADVPLLEDSRFQPGTKIMGFADLSVLEILMGNGGCPVARVPITNADAYLARRILTGNVKGLTQGQLETLQSARGLAGEIRQLFISRIGDLTKDPSDESDEALLRLMQHINGALDKIHWKS